MSTRSGRRIHGSIHENTDRTEEEIVAKNEKKTRSKRLKGNDTVIVSKNKKRNNYVSFPTDATEDEVDGALQAHVASHDENTLKEQDLNVPLRTVDEVDTVKVIRQTRRTKKISENITEEAPPPSLPKTGKAKKKNKKNKKNKNVSQEEVNENEQPPIVSKKSKKKKGKKYNTFTEEVIVPNNLNKSTGSVDSFHSAAGSPDKEIPLEDSSNGESIIADAKENGPLSKAQRRATKRLKAESCEDIESVGRDEAPNRSVKKIKLANPEQCLEVTKKSLRSKSTVNSQNELEVETSIPEVDVVPEVLNGTFDKKRRSSIKNSTFDKVETPVKASKKINTTIEKCNSPTPSKKTSNKKVDSQSKRKFSKSMLTSPDETDRVALNSTFEKVENGIPLLNGTLEKQKDTKQSTLNTTFENDMKQPALNSTFEKSQTRQSTFNSTFDKTKEAGQSTLNSTFEKNNETRQSTLNSTYDKAKDLTPSTLNTTFDKNRKSRQSLNTTFEKLKDSTFEKTKNSTFEKSKNSTFEKNKNSTFEKTKNSTFEKTKNSTFEKTETSKDTTHNSTFEKDNKLDSTFDKNEAKNDSSKSSLISSDRASEVTLDKSDDNSRISITSDDTSHENIVNTTPVLIESSLEASQLDPTPKKDDEGTPQSAITPLKREGTFTKDSSGVVMSPKPKLPVNKASTTPQKRMSLPSPGSTPFPFSKSAQKERSMMNVTVSIEKVKRRSSLAEPSRATRVMFCSPVNDPVVVVQQKKKVIKSSMKGSNKSFVFDESVSETRAAPRKRSCTQSDADAGAAKRTRLAPADRRLRTCSAAAKLSGPSTPSKKPITPLKKTFTPRAKDSHDPEAKPARTKLPNFAALHQKAFDKMESLDECQMRRARRARLLLTPAPASPQQRPKSTGAASAAKPVAKEAAPKTDTPTKGPKLPTLMSLQPGYTRFGFKMHLDHNPFSNPKPRAKPEPPRTRDTNPKPPRAPQTCQPSLAGATTTRKEAAKQTVMREKSFTSLSDKRNVTRKENRSVIKGVRTNRRFELQMKMRNINA